MKPKPLTHIPKVNSEQLTFGARLGLDLSGCTLGVAAARIEDAIAKGFYGSTNLGTPTPKQVALAANFGFDISGLSRNEGNAVISDLMTQLNLETIETEHLEPGVEVTNVHDTLGTRYVISSIANDGTVYLKGGNGKRAWARSLRRLPDA